MTTQTINPLPGVNTSFFTALSAFLGNEDANRFVLMFSDFVNTGGVIATGAGLTKTPTAMVAFVSGFYVTETGAITFTDATNNYVIADKDTVGNLGAYIRVAGTHWLVAATGGAQPAVPAGTITIATVVTAGGAVTAVTDQRPLFAIGKVKGGIGLDLSAMPNGNLLIGNGTGAVIAPLTMGAGVSQALGAGSVTLTATGIASWLVHGNYSATTSTTTATLGAMEIQLRNASDHTTVVRTLPADQVNTVTTAGPIAGGRDQAGAFAANSWIHFYWIWNGTTLSSVSSTKSPFDGGPTLPTGYTHWAYAITIRFDGASHLVNVLASGSWIFYNQAQSLIAAGNATAETFASASALVPPGTGSFLVSVQTAIHNDGVAGCDTTLTFRFAAGAGNNFANYRHRTDASGQWTNAAWTIPFPNNGPSVGYFWSNNTHCATLSLDVDVIGYEVVGAR